MKLDAMVANVRRVLRSWRGHTAHCGHHTKSKGSVTAYGETTYTNMPMNDLGTYDYCLDCLGTMAIQCAWCDRPIFIGDPVTLYSPAPGFDPPTHAVIYQKDPPILVGCLGWDCAESGSDRAGFWLPDPSDRGKGHVLRVPTPYEVIFGSPDASVMVVSDLDNINEALHSTAFPLEEPTSP